MLSSDRENNAALVSPLLRSGAEETDIGDNNEDNIPSNHIMETSAAGAEDSESRMLVQHPGARRLLFRFARIPTMADALPSIVQIVTTSGKLSALAFFAIYFALILLWLPFWLLAFLVTEIGVYVLSVATVFYRGRAVIRMIAFPGASSKVVSEIESEFAKYSVRMLVSAANCLRELATAVVSTDEASNRSNSELQILWKRSKSYRDRALGVYLDVLENVYGEEQQIPSQPDHQRTRFGTNRIRGDIGHLKGLTVSIRVLKFSNLLQIIDVLTVYLSSN